MATITFQLVSVGPNHLVYFAASGPNDVVGTIQATGVGDANIALEDAPGNGPEPRGGIVQEIVNLTGLPDQDAARRVGLDWGTPPGAPQIANVPGHRLRVRVTPIAGLKQWSIAADTDGGRLVYKIANNNLAAIAWALIYIEAVGTPERY